MKSFIAVSHFFLAFLLHMVPAQISQPPEKEKSRVIPLIEVMEGSNCQPMKQLVDVEQEFPEEVRYIYIPACVPLWRCSGCCMDDSLECHPALERNVTLQLIRIFPRIYSQSVELTFVQHHKCECRPGQKRLNDKSSESIKTRPRRRKHKKTANGCVKCQFPQQKIGLY
ncbi:snake venom vascular endothelial growth factor toxin HF-like isoform X2 [Sphaeramia orbicularis]|uniref:snake venom vascular endothelial growth factor toxin HF-like isoform X2 n=1 Tax=Sphaeramia orbicularis TaxID=375764 RepID=UPI00117F4B03|nr:snake venom vascular endothelial growth factor toxin HF-like isoform X2 [Sphaeramia orbicularis]